MKILKACIENIIEVTNKIYYLDDEKQKQLYIYDSKKDKYKMYEFKIEYNEEGNPYILLLNPLIILSSSNYINFILTFNLNELHYTFINDDEIDGDQQLKLILCNNEIINSMLETLPFKNDEEEEEWRTTLETFLNWDDFEALTLKIAKRLINKN